MGNRSPEMLFKLPEATQHVPASSPCHVQHFCPEGLWLSPLPCFLVLPLRVHLRTPLRYLSHDESWAPPRRDPQAQEVMNFPGMHPTMTWPYNIWDPRGCLWNGS